MYTNLQYTFELNIRRHNLNDRVCAIIIAQYKLDNPICAFERVDIYRQSLIPVNSIYF